jgi:O-antigen ligase
MPVMNMPRSSGLGRMALLIFLFFVIFVDLNKIKNKLFLIFLIFLVIPGIFLTQSRAIVGVYILVLLVISFSKYFKLYNLQFNDFKKNLVMFIIVPLITSILITQLKPSNLNYYKSLYFKMINDSENSKLNKVEKELKFLRNQNPSFSSYRITHWKDIIKKTKSTQSVLIGNGTQADRFLIKQTASNATLYFYASTGVIGLLIYAMIIINIVKILLKKINYLKKSSHKDNKFTFAVLVIFVFLIRGLVESSYAVFSIDYIFFIIALYFINYDTKTQS